LLEGFEPATLDVVVGPRATPALRLTMSVAGIEQETTVTDAPLQADTSANRNLNAIVADQSALEDLPVFDQDYRQVRRPCVRPTARVRRRSGR
jgi:hypothetical protein